jgi:hypothetical protein
MEPGEVRWSQLIDLPGIFDDEFNLQIIVLAEHLAAGHGSKLHLAGGKNRRQQGYQENERGT